MEILIARLMLRLFRMTDTVSGSFIKLFVFFFREPSPMADFLGCFIGRDKSGR